MRSGGGSDFSSDFLSIPPPASRGDFSCDHKTVMHSHSPGAAGAGSRERGQPVRGLLFVSAVVFMGFLSVGLFLQLP